MNIIRHKWWFLGISGLLVLASILAIAIYGFKPGIDFSGGTLWQFTVDATTTPEAVGAFLSSQGVHEPEVTLEEQTGSFIVRAGEISEANHAKYRAALEKQFEGAEDLGFQSIGASVGEELRTKSITAFLFVILGISIYIAFAFRKVSRPVASWKYGVITLLTLFHDALIPAGLVALLGHLYGLPVDTNFIVAVLVVMGFSVHDTIVVFDRIREHLRTANVAKLDFDSLVNTSIRETVARSINTSLTVVIVLIALFLFGAHSLRSFVLVIGVGTVVGTYSSIFVASPLLALWKGKQLT
jgi:preprotein translocase subunit SecF